MLIMKKISFNNWLFLILGMQYALMHLFSFNIPEPVTIAELIAFIVYSIIEISMFIYQGKHAPIGAVSGMIPLFFAVLWTVALFSHFQSDIYLAELTAINSIGVFTAYFMLLVEYKYMIKD